MESRKRRYLPDEFKRQAVERVHSSGLANVFAGSPDCWFVPHEPSISHGNNITTNM